MAPNAVPHGSRTAPRFARSSRSARWPSRPTTWSNPPTGAPPRTRAGCRRTPAGVPAWGYSSRYSAYQRFLKGKQRRDTRAVAGTPEASRDTDMFEVFQQTSEGPQNRDFLWCTPEAAAGLPPRAVERRIRGSPVRVPPIRNWSAVVPLWWGERSCDEKDWFAAAPWLELAAA